MRDQGGFKVIYAEYNLVSLLKLTRIESSNLEVVECAVYVKMH
jgi:hypothetical protein